jgi:hypothetical protein
MRRCSDYQRDFCFPFRIGARKQYQDLLSEEGMVEIAAKSTIDIRAKHSSGLAELAFIHEVAYRTF